MWTEEAWQDIWLIACALGFLGWVVAFGMLASRVRHQYAVARAPLTELASALVRQKITLAGFGLLFFFVFGMPAAISLWGWPVVLAWRVAYRSAAFIAIYVVPVMAYLVVRGMDRDARNILQRCPHPDCPTP